MTNLRFAKTRAGFVVTCSNPCGKTFFFTVALAFFYACAFAEPDLATDQPVGLKTTAELKRVPIEDLLEMDVWSASKKEEKLARVPAAMRVITQEEIRRSGALSLPEVLRLAEGLEVARVDSHTWAVSSRGFNTTTANKLQVLMDGRVLYTPLYSGVFWDVQDTLIEDIDRIEVIRGPGATLWGANAVNGVINIITRSAKDTQGWMVKGVAGTEERGIGAAQYGGQLGSNVFYRIYGKYFNRDDTVFPNGDRDSDAWQMGRGGLRLDWDPGEQNAVTFLAEGYAGDERQTSTILSPTGPFVQMPNQRTDLYGAYALGRWTRRLYEGSSLQVQTYYDRTFRHIPQIFEETRDTYDLDVQHRLPLWERHDVVWGGAYALTHDDVANTYSLAWNPPHRSAQLFSAFLQDDIALVRDRLNLTVGSKFEHNDYSGFEVQPNIRLAWTPHTNHTIWGAISRAVRSPSRLDSDIQLKSPLSPTNASFLTLTGNPEFDSEKLTAFELGYRVQALRQVALDVAAFYNLYDDLRSLEFVNGTTVLIANNLKGETYGAEVGLTYQMVEWWRWNAGYTYLHKDLRREPASLDVTEGTPEGNDPSHQFFLRSYLDLPHGFEFDSGFRYIDHLPSPRVASYVVADMRLGWRPNRHWDISVAGQNLFRKHHQEFGPAATAHEIEQSVYGKIAWRY